MTDTRTATSIDALVSEYVARNPTSRQLFERAQRGASRRKYSNRRLV